MMTLSLKTWLSGAVVALVVGAPLLASAQAYRYRPVPRPRPVVVVQPPPPAVVVHPAPVVVPAPQRAPEPEISPLSIGLRVTGLGFEGYKLHLSDLENPVMGGAGVQLRSRIDEHFGLELAADFLGGSTDDFTQVQIPITLSLLVHFFPESRIQPYVLAGAGIQFTELDYLGGAFEYGLTEGIGQLGAGVDVKLTRRLSLNADVRFLGVFRDLGSRAEISSACLASAASGTGLCANIDQVDTTDRFNGGIQFLAGISYAF